MKILMAKENPTGHKLEDLLAAIRSELNMKTQRIEDNKSSIAGFVIENNNRICALLAEAENLQRLTLEALGTIGHDPGPTGEPRLGATV